MAGIPCPLQLFQRVIAAHLHRALGSDGAFDVGVLDSVAIEINGSIQLVHIGPPIFKG